MSETGMNKNDGIRQRVNRFLRQVPCLIRHPITARQITIVTDEIGRDDVNVVRVPGTQLALEMGNPKVLNVIMLGAYIGYTEIFPVEVMWQTIEHKLGKKPKLLPLNKQAFEKGLEIGRKAKAEVK